MKHTDKQVFIIDCQLLQTKAWHRGMGKYTARTLEAWFSSKHLLAKTPQVQLLFNSQLPYHDELKKFVSGLGHVEPVFLKLEVPDYEQLSSITLAQRHNTATLDEYIERNFSRFDVSFLITSLFLDEACPTFPTNCHKTLIYYDLIPLMYIKKYLGYGTSEQFFTRFSVLYEADLVFAISETVANDLTNFLGFTPERAVNILGSSNQLQSERAADKPMLPIDRPFVIMPTGGDPRKNNELGVAAFEQFNRDNNHGYQLVITSYFNDSQKAELHKMCDSLVFTDNVSDDELWWLYTNSEGMLFPSEYEGLGMPVLEAIDAGKLVACSDIAVFREISEDAFFMFSPYSIEEAAAALHSMVHADDKSRKTKMKHYPQITKRYTWDNTASIICENMLEKTHLAIRRPADAPKLAIVCPHVCGTSEAGLWATNLYPTLSKYFNVEYFYETNTDDIIVRPSYLAYVTKVSNILELTSERAAEYDQIIYVYDDARRSSLTLLASFAHPGVLIEGSGDIAVSLDALVSRGYLAQQRRNELNPQTLINASHKVLGVPATTRENGVISFSPEMAKSPYPVRRVESLNNRIAIPMTGGETDATNAQFIETITHALSESVVEITVVSRGVIHGTERTILEGCPVDVYEEMTDHEYISTLLRADLFVDCSQPMTLEKELRKQTAINLSVPTITIADQSDVSEAIDRTYRWIMNMPQAVDEVHDTDTPDLQDVIRNKLVINDKGEH